MSVPGSPSADVPVPALIDAMSEGLYLVDRERRITVWNAAAARITGYTAAEVVGSRCGEDLLRHVDEAGAVLCGPRCPLMATMRDGQDRVAGLFLHHKDGHLVPVRVSAGALRAPEDGAIVGAVETFSDDSATEGVRERLRTAERLSVVDALTGVGNRRHLDAALARRLSWWQRHARPFGVMMLDVDRFKVLNDTYGHEVGDRVLRLVARSMAAAARRSDDVARYGGDEFVVLSDASDEEALRQLGERLRTVVERGRVVLEGGEELGVTLSAGAVVVAAQDDAAAVLRRADEMLLQAKRAGRDRLVLAV